MTPRWSRAIPGEEDASLLGRADPGYARAAEKPFQPIPRHRPCRLLAGPAEPHQHVVNPILPTLQRRPTALAARLSPRTRLAASLILLLLWLAAFALPVYTANRPFLDPDGQYLKTLNCDDTLWTTTGCGLDGEACRPFVESHFSFRCPAACASRHDAAAPHPVGPLDVLDGPLVIGSNPFRADSHICGAAILASVISDAAGGCGRLTRVGKRAFFVGKEENGVESVSFDSYFPYAFTVSPEPGMLSSCAELLDPRARVLGVSLVFSAVFSLFVAGAAEQFFVAFVAAFVHVAFVSDPPPVAPFSVSVLPDLASSFARTFLPAMFLAAVLYRLCVKRTLEGLDAPFEKVVLWLGGLWVGALANYTLRWLPTREWDDYDLKAVSQPALLVAALVGIIGFLAGFQAYCLWIEGRLERYIGFYLAVMASILGLLCVPGITLQLKPYIVALILLPATSMQTRTSMLTQGLLLGILIHALAHSGFTSPFTPQNPSIPSPSLYPSIKEPSIFFTHTGSNLTLSFHPPPTTLSYDGISVTVNDVERFRLIYVEVGRTGETFTLDWPNDVKYDEYLRYGFIKDGRVLGYGAADTWLGNGTFVRAGE